MEEQRINISREKIEQFCVRHGIRKLAFFGSILRDDFGPESDVDVLVEFEPDRVPSFFRLFEMQEELSSLFEGRRVDIRTKEDLSRYFRDRVVSTAVVQYAA